jgi:pSer/pThr/pTyr-binding forkhead associated (FHA) protein
VSISIALLTILKFFLLALLYLFFFRVLRAVWIEVSGRHPAPVPEPAPVASSRRAPPAAAPIKGRGGVATATRAPSHLKVAGKDGRTFPLADELTVGRGAGCAVSLPEDTFVSQLHARVFRKGDAYYVEDLGSTNKTYVNGRAISGPTALRRGDVLRVGSTDLEVSK